MKLSTYFQYAFRKLAEEGKFTYLNPVTKKQKQFTQNDIWEKMLDYHEYVQKHWKEHGNAN